MFNVRVQIISDEHTQNDGISDNASDRTDNLTDYGDYGLYNELSDDEDSYPGIYKSIYSLEKHFLDSEKQNGQYILGVSIINTEENVELFLCGITPKTFFQFPYHEVLDYLFYYSIMMITPLPTIDIIKIHIDTDTYFPIKKTFWLSLVQRHWRKLYNTKQQIMRKRNRIINCLYYRYYGRYPKEINTLPTLKGMLSIYQK